MKKIEVFESTYNSDSIEGRGPNVHVGYFTRRSDAEKSVEGKGVMGAGDGDVYPKTIEIYDSYEEYSGIIDQGLRLSAWRKLTPEERKAIGLEKL